MGLTLSQCKKCGRIFQSYHQDVCPLCVEEREKSFIKVRDYIYQHPQDVLSEIAKKTEVEEKLILEFLKEERLMLNDSDSALLCEKCGKPISKGRYCEGCKEFFEQILLDLSEKKRAQPDQKKLDSDPSRGRYRMHVDLNH